MWLRKDVLALAVVLSCALLSAQLSFRLRQDTFQDTFSTDLEILQGHARLPEFQNRILSPALLWVARKAAPSSVPDTTIWHVLRFLEAALAYTVLYGVALWATSSRLRALFVVGLVTYVYIWTPMSHQWEHSSDFFDVLFVALFVGLALAERSVALGIAVVVASMNRESAAFAGGIWVCIIGMRYGFRWQLWRKFLPGVIYIGLAIGIIGGLRYGLSQEFHPRQLIGIQLTVQNWRWLLLPFGATPMFLATALPFAIVLWRLPRPWSAEQKGLFGAAIVAACITLIFGIAGELRVWLPCFVLLSMLAVIGSKKQSDRQWVLSVLEENGEEGRSL